MGKQAFADVSHLPEGESEKLTAIVSLISPTSTNLPNRLIIFLVFIMGLLHVYQNRDRGLLFS